jgi:hypothetical protein
MAIHKDTVAMVTSAELHAQVEDAERELRAIEIQTTAAEHRWSEAMRRSAHESAGSREVAAVQQVWLELDERRRTAADQLDALRRQLHEERRRQIIADSMADIISRQDAARRVAMRRIDAGRRPSLLRRFFGTGVDPD